MNQTKKQRGQVRVRPPNFFRSSATKSDSLQPLTRSTLLYRLKSSKRAQQFSTIFLCFFTLTTVFLWCAACYRFIAAQDDSRAFHYASFYGPVSGDVEEISVPRSVYPYPYKSTYEQENDMTVDYVAKPDYSFIYGVEDPEFGKSHKHQETREGDVVRGEYSVLEPDGSIRRVVYTSDAQHGFQATVTRTPAEKGWSLPAQPHFPQADHQNQEPDHVDEHEHTSDDVSTALPYENHEDYPSPGISDEEIHVNPPEPQPVRYRYRY